MILIRGGRVVDPATGRDERADLILEGGVIREICAPGQAAETDFDQVIDAQNLVAAPGLVANEFYDKVWETTASNNEEE